MSVEEYKNFFRQADKDGSGTVSLEELTSVLRKNGFRGTDKAIKDMFASADTSGDGQICEDEFLRAMGLMPEKDSKAAAMRRAFNLYDRDHSGTIDRAELHAVFKELGRHLSEADITTMMKMVDTDGSGTIDYEEFITAVFKSSQ